MFQANQEVMFNGKKETIKTVVASKSRKRKDGTQSEGKMAVYLVGRQGRVNPEQLQAI